MKVRVHLFAAARQTAGRELLSVDVVDDATIADVKNAVLSAVPVLEAIIQHARWAADAEFVGEKHRINERTEVALIPPVSGG